MRMHTRIASLFVITALLMVLPGCGQNQNAGPKGPAGEPEVTVVTIAPERLVLTTELVGRTSSYQMSEVRPQVGGIIQKRLFKEGAEVKAGETLYQIDPSTYQAAYNSAKAALAKAEANAQPAKLKAERYGNLSKARAVSQQDNDDAQASHRQSEAEVVSARAALETARINLSYTRITAPISGRIGKSSVTPGALVTASQATPLATIQQANPVYVDVTQSSNEVLRMKRDLASGRIKKAGTTGARVKLLFEDGTEYPEAGTLEFSDITVDQTTGVIILRAVFPNPRQELLPGLYVRAVLEEGVEEAALLAPQAAVSRDPKGAATTMVVKADGMVEARPITVSRTVGDKWLVTSGLAAGDRVIVEGLQKVRPGAKVKAVEAGAAPAAGAPVAGTPAAAGAAPAKPEAGKPEAAKAAPAKPEAAAKTGMIKPEAAKPAMGKPEAAKAEPTAKVDPTAKAQSKRDLVYSPPKDQPWPGSEGATRPAESKPEQSSAKN